jgi:hypothetical protein
MKIFKELKTIIFSKRYIGEVIDSSFVSTRIYFEYFNALMVFTRIFYLYELFASKYASITLTLNLKELS